MRAKALDARSLHDADGKFEIWSAGAGEAYVYTDNWKFVHVLKRKFGRGTEYIRNGHILAWQFKIPAGFVELLKRNWRRLRRSGVDEEVLTEELVKVPEPK